MVDNKIINEIKKTAIKNNLNIVFRYEINTDNPKKLRETETPQQKLNI